MTSKVYMAKKVKIRIKRIRVLVRRVVQSIKDLGSSIGEMPVRIYYISWVVEIGEEERTVPQPHQWVYQGNDPA
jgi:hypothetical protein